MRKKTFYIVFLFYLLGIFVSSLSAQVEVVSQGPSCPVMHGERIKQKFYVDYKGQRVYLCCRNCVIAFKKRPEKYIKRLQKEKEKEAH